VSAVPHRIKDVLGKPPERWNAKDRRRIEAWDRRQARLRLEELQERLAVLGHWLDAAGDGPLYHDPRQPAFSRECQAGRPADCRWYPCGNDAHPDPRRVYEGIARRWQLRSLSA
jgi:hypothetical protein